MAPPLSISLARTRSGTLQKKSYEKRVIRMNPTRINI